MIMDSSLLEWTKLGEEGSTENENEWKDRKVGRRKNFSVRRMKLAKHFIRKNIEPEWMVSCILPVLPPELRPIIQIDSGKLMSSDINELDRRVIYQNNTLIGLLTTSRSTPEELVTCQEKLVQEVVDTLLDNGIRRQPMRDGNNKVYKSFSDIIEGVAKSKIREKEPIVWEILQEVMRGHPVLLNRAPNLHRLGVHEFQPILVEGRAIYLHPLVWKGFDGDFDGDQMAVHVPLSLEAQAEAHLLIFSHTNLLSPAIGDPIIVPTQDMLIGLYVLTSGNCRGICANKYNSFNSQNSQNEKISNNNLKYMKKKNPFFCNSYDAIGAYRHKRINFDSPFWLRWRIDQCIMSSIEVPIEVHYEYFGTYYEIYGDYLVIRSIKKGICCIYIRITIGHISFYREIEEAIQGFSRAYSYGI
ncbi:unnamed protein product [Vicia faba]|uniref:DNA-directed RNA polymerase subunit n=1 Tax=Vicia faba TaxID=3906 RepID=A0AAV1ABE1_VICFA|nr:unnamed protein product [Vicia faba]